MDSEFTNFRVELCSRLSLYNKKAQLSETQKHLQEISLLLVSAQNLLRETQINLEKTQTQLKETQEANVYLKTINGDLKIFLNSSLHSNSLLTDKITLNEIENKELLEKQKLLTFDLQKIVSYSIELENTLSSLQSYKKYNIQDFENLKIDYEYLKKHNQYYENKISSLNKENVSLKTEIESIKTELDFFKSESSKIKKKIKSENNTSFNGNKCFNGDKCMNSNCKYTHY